MIYLRQILSGRHSSPTISFEQMRQVPNSWCGHARENHPRRNPLGGRDDHDDRVKNASDQRCSDDRIDDVQRRWASVVFGLV